MRAEEITEMPEFIDCEMPYYEWNGVSFYSEDSVARAFQVVARHGKTIVMLSNDKTFAIIGEEDIRKDGKPGVRPQGRLEFKTTPDLSWTHDIHIVGNNTLQVDFVQLMKTEKIQGLGTLLYMSLAKVGYTIISDTTQYLGGRKLWEKIAREANSNGLQVLIADNGTILHDKNSIIDFNGNNYPHDEIWSPQLSLQDGSKKHILLILKKA